MYVCMYVFLCICYKKSLGQLAKFEYALENGIIPTNFLIWWLYCGYIVNYLYILRNIY